MSDDIDVEKLVREVRWAEQQEEWREEARAERRAESAKRLAAEYEHRVKSDLAKKLIAADRASTTIEAARRLELGAMMMCLHNENEVLRNKNSLCERVFVRVGMWLLYILCVLISLIVAAAFTGSLLVWIVLAVIGVDWINKSGEKFLTKLFHIDAREMKIAKNDSEFDKLEKELYALLPQPMFKEYKTDDAFIYALYLK